MKDELIGTAQPAAPEPDSLDAETLDAVVGGARKSGEQQKDYSIAQDARAPT